MVDFNTETAIQTPAKTIEGALILEKRENFLQAKENYYIMKFQGAKPDTSIMRARLLNVIDQWYGFLNRQKDCPLNDWLSSLNNDDISSDEIMIIFYEISVLMDKSNLTKIDREVLDTTNIELENETKGLD